jgi:hypothetical protein
MHPWIDLQCRRKVSRYHTYEICLETAMGGQFGVCSFAKKLKQEAPSYRDPVQARQCGPLSIQLPHMTEVLQTSGEDDAEV